MKIKWLITNFLSSSGEAPKPAAIDNDSAETQPSAPTPPPAQPKTVAVKLVDNTKLVPAGLNTSANNYMRREGPNTDNFLTDRPSTKVHSAPGGGSSLDYLFVGGNNKPNENPNWVSLVFVIPVLP